MRTNINGVNYDNEHLTDYYGFASYFLTGESKAYHVRNGAANRIKSNRPFQFNGSGWGAWEIATGYDYIDMNSGVIAGGEADMVRFGLNWYLHSNVKFQENVIHMLDINTARTPITKADGYSGGAGARPMAGTMATLVPSCRNGPSFLVEIIFGTNSNPYKWRYEMPKSYKLKVLIFSFLSGFWINAAGIVNA